MSYENLTTGNIISEIEYDMLPWAEQQKYIKLAPLGGYTSPNSNNDDFFSSQTDTSSNDSSISSDFGFGFDSNNNSDSSLDFSGFDGGSGGGAGADSGW